MHTRNRAPTAKEGRRLLPGRIGRVLVNLAGAASAALFARASLEFYLHTHRLIGGLFFLEQAWFVIAFLVRRPARVVLGRSFGFVAADRGLVIRGPYAVIRHPVYAAYLLIQVGYLLQSLSWRNAAVVALVTCANAGRAVAEERLLATSASYETYRQRVRWRLIPGLW